MFPTIENIALLLKSSSELMEDNLPKAILKAREAEKIATEIFDTKALADCSKQIALCYSQASNYIETLKAVLHAQELYQSINNYKGEADCLNILGGVYNFLKDYQKRLECNLRCLELRKKVNDKNGQLSTYNNIGDTYTVMGDYDNALRYFNICLSFPDITTRIKAIVHHNIGEVNFFKKDYPNSLIYLNQGLELGKESNYWQIIIASSTMIGAIHNIQNNTTEAIEILNTALKVAQEKKSIEEEIPIYKELSITYAKLNDFNKAYEFLNLHNNF